METWCTASGRIALSLVLGGVTAQSTGPSARGSIALSYPTVASIDHLTTDESLTDPPGLRSFFGGTGQAVSVLNGLFGDLLDERRSRLALPMTLRCGSAELRLDREALAEQLAGATGAVCVFVPGLMSSDAVWRFPRQAEMTYGSRLAADRN